MRFCEEAERGQLTSFPQCPDAWINENNPLRGIDAFANMLASR